MTVIVPVATEHVGCVKRVAGAEGEPGAAFMTTLADAGEVQPDELVTVKLYVFAVKPDIVLLVVDPAIPPGLIVQLPEGNPLNTTLPVDVAHVGCVMVPTIGAVGVAG